MKTYSTFLVMVICGFVSAQIAPIVPSSTTIANASVAVQESWSAFQNTAALAHINNITVGAQYENRFMLKELSVRSVSAGFKTNYVNIGLSYSYHGYSVYNEMIGGIGLARNFDDKFSMGVQFNYYSAYFSAADESRYRGTVLTQFGVSSRILPKLVIGCHTFNPFQASIKTENVEKRLPSIFSIGSNYAFSENFLWLAQIDKEVSSNFRLATGFEYTMLNVLIAKLGVYGQDYLVPALGFGVEVGNLQLHLNCELHPQLGLNTLANVTYNIQ